MGRPLPMGTGLGGVLGRTVHAALGRARLHGTPGDASLPPAGGPAGGDQRAMSGGQTASTPASRLTIRRVVTGVDASGRSVVNSDGPAPVVVERPNGTR